MFTLNEQLGKATRTAVGSRMLALMPLAIALYATAETTLAQGPFPPIPDVPVPAENPITAEKAVLGKILFWEEQLSSDNTMACGSCHDPGSGGSDERVTASQRHAGLDGVFNTVDDTFGSNGIPLYDDEGWFQPHAMFGFDAQVTPRTSPSFIGAMFSDTLFWDGRAEGEFVDPQTGQVVIRSGGALEIQAVEPILNPIEMGEEGRTWGEVIEKLELIRPMKLASNLPPDMAAAVAANQSYPGLFEAAFGDRSITSERIALSLATYMRTLVPNDTPWDAHVRGIPNSLTPDEEAGWGHFQSAGCIDCHTPPLFTDHSFRNIGIRPIEQDHGRQIVTGLFEDRGKFRVPSLRNVGLRNRYFHDGLRTGLNAIVNFYNGGGIETENKDPLIVPLTLDSQARDQLQQFLMFGLNDWRVQWEVFPFDRPRLHSENGPAPATIIPGTGVAGTGGHIPEILIHSPPAQRAPGFRIGVTGGLGGARAILVLRDAGPGTPAGSLFATGGIFGSTVSGGVTYYGTLSRIYKQLLLGNGPGEGYATRPTRLPPAGHLTGLTVEAQWFIIDPAAPGGMARSNIAEFTIF